MAADKNQWVQWIMEIQDISQSGLAYSHNEFDKERYLKLRNIIAEITAIASEKSFKEIQRLFTIEKGYATPKVDVRAFILEKNKVLLVKERADGLWALPGGWADVHTTPSEATIKEVKEETGYDAKAIKLLALWDRLKHDHPPQWPHIYKCFFHCEITGGAPQHNIEISEIDFFSLEKLPPLSTPRVTENQLVRLYEIIEKNLATQFD